MRGLIFVFLLIGCSPAQVGCEPRVYPDDGPMRSNSTLKGKEVFIEPDPDSDECHRGMVWGYDNENPPGMVYTGSVGTNSWGLHPSTVCVPSQED